MEIAVLCVVRPGLRASERAVAVLGLNRNEYLRIEANYLWEEDGRTYLPVGLIYEHPPSGSVLIELPLEADSGTWRMFVPKQNVVRTDLRQCIPQGSAQRVEAPSGAGQPPPALQER